MTARSYTREELTFAAYLGFLAAVVILGPLGYFFLSLKG